MIKLMLLILYRCWLICNMVWRKDKSQNMICKLSWVYTHWFYFLFPLLLLCRWLKKKKSRTCILFAVNVNINPHQRLCNPAMISLKLKQIINFVNRAEDWWCHPCRQFICKEFYIDYANQHWNNTRREQKIKEPLNLHVHACKAATQACKQPPPASHQERAACLVPETVGAEEGLSITLCTFLCLGT